MTSPFNHLTGFWLACGFSLLLVVTPTDAQAQTLTVLHSFRGFPNDGQNPSGPLLLDGAGKLVGTTNWGGGATSCGGGGCGTVFRLSSDKTETLLYSFQGGADGAGADGGVISDRSGNLYGTTFIGGGEGCGGHGCGTVFKITKGGAERVLYSFQGGTDGATPGGLIADPGGDLYGPTSNGGAPNCDGNPGDCGTIFKISPDGTETVLYVFKAGSDGFQPGYSLVMDGAGNLYGTTYWGGGNGGCGYGCGTVYKLATDGGETILFSFDGVDGQAPDSTLLMDKQGNLFGTTAAGGGSRFGTVFKLAPDCTETVLHAFTGGSDGGMPSGSLIEDQAGNLYGTANQGGDRSCRVVKHSKTGCGTVFKIAPDGTEAVLYTFESKLVGDTPTAGVISDKQGNLYGSTFAGGDPRYCGELRCGTLFEITP